MVVKGFQNGHELQEKYNKSFYHQRNLEKRFELRITVVVYDGRFLLKKKFGNERRLVICKANKLH